jgi:hypothetical protein
MYDETAVAEEALGYVTNLFGIFIGMTPLSEYAHLTRLGMCAMVNILLSNGRRHVEFTAADWVCILYSALASIMNPGNLEDPDYVKLLGDMEITRRWPDYGKAIMLCTEFCAHTQIEQLPVDADCQYRANPIIYKMVKMRSAQGGTYIELHDNDPYFDSVEYNMELTNRGESMVCNVSPDVFLNVEAFNEFVGVIVACR